MSARFTSSLLLGPPSLPLGCLARVGARGESQHLVARQPHPVDLERVAPDPGDELGLIVGPHLETAVAAE
jgi:hypothetical protein